MNNFFLKCKDSPLYFAGFTMNGAFQLTPFYTSSMVSSFSEEKYAYHFADNLNRMYPGMDFVVVAGIL